jgi:hypothetical protein
MALEADLPQFGALAESVLADALRRRGDRGAAGQALERGRTLLDQAAARIDDSPLRRDFLNRPDFRSLRPDATAGIAGSDRRLLA